MAHLRASPCFTSPCWRRGAARPPALERTGPLWYRLLPVIRAAEPEVWSCEHSSMDRPTERIVNHLRRCVGKFGHGVTICAGAAPRTSMKLACAMIGASPRLEPGQGSPGHPPSAERPGSAFGPGGSRLPWLIRAELARGENVDVELETSCPESAAWSAGDVVLKTVRAAGGGAERLNGRSVGPQRARRIRFAVSFLICCAASCMPRDRGLATS